MHQVCQTDGQLAFVDGVVEDLGDAFALDVALQVDW